MNKPLRYFEIDQQDGLVVVKPIRNLGTFAEDEARGEWEQVFKAVDQSDEPYAVLDMSELEYFGSTMLEWIIQLGKRVARRDGQIAICNVSPAAEEILTISRINTIYPVVKSRDAAIEKLKPSA